MDPIFRCPVPAKFLLPQLTHNVCRTFPEGFHKVRAVPMFWKGFFHNVSIIYMFNIFFTQNMELPKIYEIKDDLHDLGVMGNQICVLCHMIGHRFENAFSYTSFTSVWNSKQPNQITFILLTIISQTFTSSPQIWICRPIETAVAMVCFLILSTLKFIICLVYSAKKVSRMSVGQMMPKHLIYVPVHCQTTGRPVVGHMETTWKPRGFQSH